MFTIERVKVSELEPGDCYLWGEVGCEGRTAREVLGIVAARPFGGVLLEVRRADGNVTRSFLNGAVDVVHGGQACRDCGQLFPYSPDADRCPACVTEQFGEENLTMTSIIGEPKTLVRHPRTGVLYVSNEHWVDPIYALTDAGREDEFVRVGTHADGWSGVRELLELFGVDSLAYGEYVERGERR